MKRLSAITSFIGSRMLTVWLGGVFIIYYLSVAVWSKEAFASLVAELSGNNLFRFLYIMFCMNVIVRMLGSLRGVRHRYKFVFRLPLFAGLIMLLISFFMSLNFRKDMRQLAGEGDLMEFPWEKGGLQVVRVEPALKKNALRTDDSAIFDYEPGATLMDGNGAYHSIRAFPPVKAGSTYLHVLNFGIGPGVELRRGNEVVSKGYMALRLTPFGSVDSFELEPFPYKFLVSIIPNRVIKRGGETARDYDLEKPLYRVSVTKGDRLIAEAETDSSITFDGNMTLGFFTPADWVLLEAAHDPFLVWFASGLVLLLSSFILYPVSLLTLWLHNRQGRHASNSL